MISSTILLTSKTDSRQRKQSFLQLPKKDGEKEQTKKRERQTADKEKREVPKKKERQTADKEKRKTDS